VGIGSESDCLLGLLNRILETSDSEAGLKTEKSGGTTGYIRTTYTINTLHIGLGQLGRVVSMPSCPPRIGIR